MLVISILPLKPIHQYQLPSPAVHFVATFKAPKTALYFSNKFGFPTSITLISHLFLPLWMGFLQTLQGFCPILPLPLLVHLWLVDRHPLGLFG